MKMIQTTTRQPIKWQIQLYWWCLELISHDGVQECSKTRTSSFVAVSVRWIFSACFSKISSRWSDPVVKIEKQVSTKLIVHTGPGTHKLAAVAFKSPLKKQYFAIYFASISAHIALIFDTYAMSLGCLDFILTFTIQLLPSDEFKIENFSWKIPKPWLCIK